ncbi:MAG TPA: alpha/beta fold hydrolase [Acidimicrobiia bacterium]|nr:alpha/beta fold hydrolase [Acidimicrobiia bacterium]
MTTEVLAGPDERNRERSLPNVYWILFSMLGLAGVIVGFGIGARWLSAGVVNVTTLASLSGLLLGSALVVLGLRRATAGRRPLARFGLGTALALVVALIAWTLTPAVMATYVPPSETDWASPSGLAINGREVRFLTSDGVQLWAWYLPPPQGKVVILRHGAGSSASDVIRQALVLVANGYGVLMTDARGNGHSEGRAMDFGWYGDRDIEAAVSFLIAQPEVDAGRIAAMGMSMGGEEAIGAAGADRRIAAVVAEGATARTAADKAWLSDEYGWRGWVQVQLERLQYGFADVLTEAPMPATLASAALQASPRPILLITAGLTPDEANAAEHIRLNAAGNVAVWTVPQADHIQGLETSPAEWETKVIGFLDEALLG